MPEQCVKEEARLRREGLELVARAAAYREWWEPPQPPNSCPYFPLCMPAKCFERMHAPRPRLNIVRPRFLENMPFAAPALGPGSGSADLDPAYDALDSQASDGGWAIGLFWRAMRIHGSASSPL